MGPKKTQAKPSGTARKTRHVTAPKPVRRWKRVRLDAIKLGKPDHRAEYMARWKYDNKFAENRAARAQQQQQQQQQPQPQPPQLQLQPQPQQQPPPPQQPLPLPQSQQQQAQQPQQQQQQQQTRVRGAGGAWAGRLRRRG
ncbi:MAG: hypothetical protein Q9159_002865 [Coniocarpon cinnabarinum]